VQDLEYKLQRLETQLKEARERPMMGKQSFAITSSPFSFGKPKLADVADLEEHS